MWTAFCFTISNFWAFPVFLCNNQTLLHHLPVFFEMAKFLFFSPAILLHIKSITRGVVYSHLPRVSLYRFQTKKKLQEVFYMKQNRRNKDYQ